MNTDQLVNNSICVLYLAKIIDELLYIYNHVDIHTDSKGHRRSKYERQADFIAPRMNVYKPSPTFVFHTNDLQSGSPLEREFASLDDAILDDVKQPTQKNDVVEINQDTKNKVGAVLQSHRSHRTQESKVIEESWRLVSSATNNVSPYDKLVLEQKKNFESELKKHAIRKDGLNYCCDNCDEWGDKPHMTVEGQGNSPFCTGVKKKR